MRIQKRAALAAGLALVWLGLALPQAAGAQTRGQEQSLVNRYCLGCHNDRALQGGLSLEAAPLDDVAGHAEVWERVVRKLRAGAMPPQGSARPEAAAYQGLLDTIETALDARADAAPDPATDLRTPSRRRASSRLAASSPSAPRLKRAPATGPRPHRCKYCPQADLTVTSRI